MKNRPSWDKYFIDIAKLAATRSTCTRRSVGAIIVKSNNILSTGYNGAPAGIKHCEEATCIRNVRGIPSGAQLDICIGLHAEQNAILQAAKNGVSIKDSTIYCTTHPCLMCAKMIINCGIIEVVYDEDYDDEASKQILGEAKIVTRRMVI